MGRFGAIFAVAGLVDDQHAAVLGGTGRLRAQQVQALGVDVLRRPGGLGEKPLQALGMWMLGAEDGLVW